MAGQPLVLQHHRQAARLPQPVGERLHLRGHLGGLSVQAARQADDDGGDAVLLVAQPLHLGADACDRRGVERRDRHAPERPRQGGRGVADGEPDPPGANVYADYAHASILAACRKGSSDAPPCDRSRVRRSLIAATGSATSCVRAPRRTPPVQSARVRTPGARSSAKPPAWPTSRARSSARFASWRSNATSASSRRGKRKTRRAPRAQELARGAPQAGGAGGRSAPKGLPELRDAVRRSLQARAARRAGAAAQRQRPARVRARQPRGRGAGVPPAARRQRPRAHAGRAARRARGADRQGRASCAPRRRARRAARRGAERAVAARAALLDDIDARRDLTAQYLGELQQAYDRLGADMTVARQSGRIVEPVSIPVGPFRGALDWPVAGRLAGRFGQPGATAGSRAQRHRGGLGHQHAGARRPRRHGGLRRGVHRASARWSSWTTARTPTPFTAIWPRRSSKGETWCGPAPRWAGSGWRRSGASRRSISSFASTAVWSIPYNG